MVLSTKSAIYGREERNDVVAELITCCNFVADNTEKYVTA